MHGVQEILRSSYLVGGIAGRPSGSGLFDSGGDGVVTLARMCRWREMSKRLKFAQSDCMLFDCNGNNAPAGPPATKLVTKTRDLVSPNARASHLGNHEREESCGRQWREASRTHHRKFVCGTDSISPFIVILLEDNTSCARIFEPPATKIFCKRIFGKDIFFPEKL